MPNEKLKFYDMKAKKSFESDEYKIQEKMVNGNKRRFAVAQAPSGIAAWRIMKKE